MQNSLSARFSRVEIWKLSSGGGESAREGELWGNARVLSGEVSRVCVSGRWAGVAHRGGERAYRERGHKRVLRAKRIMAWEADQKWVV